MFKVGDMIKQRHQRGALPRLVIKLTDNPDVVWVHDPEKGYITVLTWSHDLLRSGDEDPEAMKEALEHVISEEFKNTPWKL